MYCPKSVVRIFLDDILKTYHSLSSACSKSPQKSVILAYCDWGDSAFMSKFVSLIYHTPSILTKRAFASQSLSHLVSYPHLVS